MKPPPLSSDTKDFYEKVYVFKRKYPFWVITTLALPRPELIPQSRRLGLSPFGHWCRVPHLGTDIAAWGFETAMHRDAFVQIHRGETWQLR